MMSKQSKVGFAIAIFELAKEEKKLKKIYSEVKILRQVINENPEFISILSSTSTSFDDKEEIISKTFKGFDEILLNSIKILSQNNRFNFIRDICTILIQNLQEELKIKEGIVYSTYKLSNNELKKLEDKMTKESKAQVELVNLIDNELIGGFKIVIDDIIIEDSIKSDLNDLKDKLLYKGEF